jgi:hypothetical protein
MQPPLIVGRYALYSEIASGGMGSVHFGRLVGAAGFSRLVAIKRMHPHLLKDRANASMFLDEARLAARIRHPNVVPIVDVVAMPDELLLVMDYVPGAPLSLLLRQAQEQGTGLPHAAAANVACAALRGLEAAHQAKDARGEPLQLVHRDVSPQNLLVGTDGGTRVIDFGVAKATGRSASTQSGQVKGKIAYMAPEQLRSDQVDARTDVFAMGVVLWEALTSRRLFQSDNEPKTMMAVLEQPVEHPSTLAPQLPVPLGDVVMRALQRDPKLRFTSAQEMAAAIEAVTTPATTTEVAAWVTHVAAPFLHQREREAARVEADDRLDDALMASHSLGAVDSLDALLDLLAPRLAARFALAGDGAVLEQTFLALHQARGHFRSGGHVREWAEAIAQRNGAKADEVPTKELAPVPPELRTRVLARARQQPSLTRPQLVRQLTLYAGAALAVGVSIFFATGAIRDDFRALPAWFIGGGAAGWLACAVAATWVALGGGTMLGPSRRVLLGVAIATPILLFAWMSLWGLSCPDTWPARIGFKCMWMSLVIGALPLATLLRARRGTDPVHPHATGAALGAASGAWAGVLVDLWCPIPTVSHVAIGHVLPMVVLVALGALLGRSTVAVRRAS